MGRHRLKKITPGEFGHLINPSEGGSGKGTLTGSPEPVARSKKRSTPRGRLQVNTASGQVWGETLLPIIIGVPGLLIVVRLEIIHTQKKEH